MSPESTDELQLLQMAHMLGLRRAGLLAYPHVPITTEPLEGMKQKIKTLHRQAHGFRDAEFSGLRHSVERFRAEGLSGSPIGTENT